MPAPYSYDRNLFKSWVKQQLLPVFKAVQIVILDTASFHKGGKIEE